MVTKLGCISDSRLVVTVSKKKIGFPTELINENKDAIGLDIGQKLMLELESIQFELSSITPHRSVDSITAEKNYRNARAPV